MNFSSTDFKVGRRNFTVMACASLGMPAAHARTVWKLATGYRGDLFHTMNLGMMAGEVDAATKGELHIDIHPENTLVKLNEVLAAVQSGKIQAGETIMTSMVGEIPVAGADAVPFIVASYADAKRLWRHQRPLVERHLDARGLKLLYAVPWPPQGLYSTRPIKGPGDLRGSRMRTYNTTTSRIAAWFGAEAVDVPTSEIGRALAEGRIDSMMTSGVTGVENKVWSHLHYYYEVNAWLPKNIVFANRKAIDALGARSRDALLKACSAAEPRGWAASEAAAYESIDELRRNGVKIERVPRDVGVEMKRLGERFSREWIRKVGPEANQIFVPYYTQG